MELQKLLVEVHPKLGLKANAKPQSYASISVKAKTDLVKLLESFATGLSKEMLKAKKAGSKGHEIFINAVVKITTGELRNHMVALGVKEDADTKRAKRKATEKTGKTKAREPLELIFSPKLATKHGLGKLSAIAKRIFVMSLEYLAMELVEVSLRLSTNAVIYPRHLKKAVADDPELKAIFKKVAKYQ